MPSPYRYHHPRPPLRSQAKAVARRDEEKAMRLRRMLAISVMSALTLGAVLLARAETWVTVNPDGSVTKTEVQANASQAPEAANTQTTGGYAVRRFDTYPDDLNGYNGVDQPVATGSITQPSTQTANTTFFAGTYYPVPTYSYSYPVPGGYTYPVGPIYPRVPPPFVTTLPSTGYAYGYGAPYCPPPVSYPYPSYPYPYPVYSYPNYAGTGIYYSGPAGGGGTIYSNSTSSNSGYGLRLGNGGLNITIGNSHRSSRSTTTVTTNGAP